jgi:hypothetical protein
MAKLKIADGILARKMVTTKKLVVTLLAFLAVRVSQKRVGKMELFAITTSTVHQNIVKRNSLLDQANWHLILGDEAHPSNGGRARPCMTMGIRVKMITSANVSTAGMLLLVVSSATRNTGLPTAKRV